MILSALRDFMKPSTLNAMESDVGAARQPIRRFAAFLRGYNVGLSLIVAAVPIPIAKWDLVPIYDSIKPFLTLITSIGSYLAVGYIFSQRGVIARLYFPRARPGGATYAHERSRIRLLGVTPLLLAALSLLLFTFYFGVVNDSIEQVAYEHATVELDGNASVGNACDVASSKDIKGPVPARLAAFGLDAPLVVSCRWRGLQNELAYSVRFRSRDAALAILKETPSPSVPGAFFASSLFLGAFLSATSAFILMALREYVQEHLQITERQLINYSATRSARFDIEGAPGLYGVVEFSIDDVSLQPLVTGPFCIWHDLIPRPRAVDGNGRVTSWQHLVERPSGPPRRFVCPVAVSLTDGELQRRLAAGANPLIDAFVAGRTVASSKEAEVRDDAIESQSSSGTE